MNQEDFKGFLSFCAPSFRYRITAHSPEIDKEMIWLDQDYDEIVETRRVPLRETLELIERGEIRDAKSVASLLLAMRVVGNDGSVG